jgi:hypothetical protein
MDAGACGAVVTWIAPTATDNCPGVVFAQDPGSVSGTLFPAGTETISYTATDAAGNVSNCSFTVTVNPDAESPVFDNCPANIGPIAMDPGTCGAVITWDVITASDNCDGSTTVFQFPPNPLGSGSTFPAGVTSFNYLTLDVLGNSASCTFTVTVSPDAEAPSSQVALQTLDLW